MVEDDYCIWDLPETGMVFNTSCDRGLLLKRLIDGKCPHCKKPVLIKSHQFNLDLKKYM